MVIRGRRLVLGLLIAIAALWIATQIVPPLAMTVASFTGQRKVPIYKVERPDRKLSISFDATWGADHTDELLDILDEHGVKTTFFLAGYWAERFPEYVKKIVERGHEIGNHSYEHPHYNRLSKEEIRNDLQRNHELLQELTGVEAYLFRPPFGEYSDKVIEVAEELGYFTIQWSIDSLDWKDVSADFMVKRITERAGPGEIVLFHNAGRHTPEAVRLLLPRLKAAGFEIVPISQLIYREGYVIESHSGVQRPLPGEVPGPGEDSGPSSDSGLRPGAPAGQETGEDRDRQAGREGDGR